MLQYGLESLERENYIQKFSSSHITNQGTGHWRWISVQLKKNSWFITNLNIHTLIAYSNLINSFGNNKLGFLQRNNNKYTPNIRSESISYTTHLTTVRINFTWHIPNCICHFNNVIRALLMRDLEVLMAVLLCCQANSPQQHGVSIPEHMNFLHH